MLTLLITGANPKDRINLALNHQPNSPHILDGSIDPITIEQVRLFQKDLALSHTDSTTRFAFILEAQSLTLPSQQALLKILEEPPTNTQFILTSSKASCLLPTIVSRCQVRRLNMLTNLGETEINITKDILRQVNTLPHASLVTLAESLVKNQDQLTNLLLLLKQSLHDHPTPKRAIALKLINTCLLDLTTNIQPQLAIENLLFHLKALTH